VGLIIMGELMIKHSKVRILFVDDNRMLLNTFSQLLNLAGFEVVTAESVDDAESFLMSGEYKFDIVILDYELPVRNGMSLVTRLNNLDNIPFVVLSSYSKPEYVEEASRLGAMSYLVKPIEIEQLIPAINAAISRSNEIQALRETRLFLQNTLESEREINVAIGLSMIQSKLSRKEAFEKLRLNARSRRVKLVVLAKEVIQSAEQANNH
jgi:AmiR/NasT family two-component response regulator